MPSYRCGAALAADLKIMSHEARQRVDAMPPEERRKRLVALVYWADNGVPSVRYRHPHIDGRTRHSLAMSTGRRARVRRGR